MALQKQPVAINFSKGLDTKSDPFQVAAGNFLSLQNSVFTTAGRLTKRNGYQKLTTLPTGSNATTLTTLNDNLIATGQNLYSFSKDTSSWLNKGTVQPVQLVTQPLVRVSTSQTGSDTAVTSNGLTCLVYMDNGLSYYQISDSTTGEQIVSRVLIPTAGVNPRVFLLGSYFIVTFVTSTSILQYIAIPINNPSSPSPATTLNSSSGTSSPTAGYDGVIANNDLFLSWSASSGSIDTAVLTSGLIASTASIIPASVASLLSMTVDVTSSRVWVTWWDSGSMNGYTASYNYNLVLLLGKTQIITATPIAEITSVATNSVLTVFYQNINNYSYTGQTSGAAIRSDYISKLTVSNAGSVSAATIILRSVGLASKAFMSSSGTIYMLAVYGDTNQISSLDNSNQPSYFLIDSTGAIYMRLAYANGGGYEQTQVLPSVTSVNSQYYVSYLKNDFLATVNKNVGAALPAGTPTNAIYTQTGVNLAVFSINNVGQHSSEIAGALHLTGGQLWEYDGVRPVEHGFQVWPENVSIATSGTGGNITAQQYNYVFVYEWTDNQGNLHRSAPSIPTSITTSGATSVNSIKVPTLRLTYKIAPNPVRIVGYRWSTAQPVFYQFTSITMPVSNTAGTSSTWTDSAGNIDTSSTGADSVTIVDSFPDSSILGQTLLYTTGGVIENIAAPASIASALFKNRLFLIDAEDPNLLWFSKQVIENTPVEMSDLLTLFVAPTSGAQGSTGPMTALSAMDDKLIIFKQDAIYYLTGTGPDNTGAQNDFTDPVFITSSVGCSNPDSIVLTPNGIMFQSDKGIYVLGRDLSTVYIGAPVEAYNSRTVMSAQSIPATTYVLFVLDSNTTLMYDYFYNQWGTHTNTLAIFSTLYQGVHTYLNSLGQIFQMLSNSYIDGSEPVLMSLTTSWINIAGLQGFERFYFANLLGTYFSPFKLNVTLAYDYNSSALHNVIVQPDNFANPWGGEAVWGSGPQWGGPGNVFSARVFPNKQKCQSFQVTIQEVYDSTLGQAPGQGLSLSGLALIIGVKRGFRTQKASRSFG